MKATSRQKLISVPQLLKLKKKYPKARFVFTNGCFDILHAGHVQYLEKARTLGDFLIVALNTDASTRRLKGPTRPINSLEDRMRVIAGLESVSFVLSFNEDTPEKLIQKVTPQVLVKGADYQVKDIVGADWVLKHGGKVKRISFLKGRSTSKVVEKISRK